MGFKAFEYPKQMKDKVNDRFDITLIGLYSGDIELKTLRIQKSISGGYFFSDSPVPSKSQVFVQDTVDLIKLVSSHISQFSEGSTGCEAVLIGQDLAKICHSLKGNGINIKGTDSSDGRRW